MKNSAGFRRPRAVNWLPVLSRSWQIGKSETEEVSCHAGQGQHMGTVDRRDDAKGFIEERLTPLILSRLVEESQAYSRFRARPPQDRTLSSACHWTTRVKSETQDRPLCTATRRSCLSTGQPGVMGETLNGHLCFAAAAILDVLSSAALCQLSLRKREALDATSG